MFLLSNLFINHKIDAAYVIITYFICQFLNVGLRTNFTTGGVCAFKAKSYGDKEKMEPMEQMIVNDREGFYGWFGLGGSILQVHNSVYTLYIVVFPLRNHAILTQTSFIF